jgi:hypothetical protein
MSTVDTRKKSKLGRPPVDTEELRARVSRHIVDGIDAWIAAQPDPKPSRPEAIRRLLEKALAT